MKLFKILLTIFFLLAASASQASIPVSTDTRIKTLIYGENEVFQMNTKYGYQANIEFSEGETVDTISMGDVSGWQVTPSGKRLFIKALQENAHTNMTVITNKRVYQFELSSVAVEDEAELTYVVRFYYPEKDFDLPNQVSLEQIAGGIKQQRQLGYNFSYTLEGPSDISPLKVFDDGKYTYFEFPNRNTVIPSIAAADRDGRSGGELIYRIVGNYVVVEKISPKFQLLHGKSQAMVFNEGITAP